MANIVAWLLLGSSLHLALRIPRRHPPHALLLPQVSGQEGWILSTVLTALTYVLFWSIFEKVFTSRFPKPRSTSGLRRKRPRAYAWASFPSPSLHAIRQAPHPWRPIHRLSSPCRRIKPGLALQRQPQDSAPPANQLESRRSGPQGSSLKRRNPVPIQLPGVEEKFVELSHCRIRYLEAGRPATPPS